MRRTAIQQENNPKHSSTKKDLEKRSKPDTSAKERKRNEEKINKKDEREKRLVDLGFVCQW